jgi:3D (Asp-Asp-Asp) domain-containing protein
METTRRRAITVCVWSALVMAPALVPPAATLPECPSRTMRISFYTCAEGFSHCLTKRGHQPIPFRTVAVGDRTLLGRWLYIQDLGGWVHASDTGVALRRDWIDVFIGDSRMAPFAHRLGIQHWTVQVCPPVGSAASPTPVPANTHPAADEASGRDGTGDRAGSGEGYVQREDGAATLSLAPRLHTSTVQPGDGDGDGEPEAAHTRGEPRR